MKKEYFLLFAFCLTFSLKSQVNSEIKKDFTTLYPVFSECKNNIEKGNENCFYNNLKNRILQNFKVSENLKESKYQGFVEVLFEIDWTGKFKILYVSAEKQELIDETYSVFNQFPKIEPQNKNGKPVDSKYSIKFQIPLQKDDAKTILILNQNKKVIQKTQLDSLDLTIKKYNNPEFQSNLNIPFSHSFYSRFDSAMNLVGSNNHTASKPYTYNEVNQYYSIEKTNENLKKNVSTWIGKKLWNENLVEIQGNDYWFTLNPIVDLQFGKSTNSKNNYTYINTRGINFRGGLSEKVNFSTSIFESQGKFADYFNNYAKSIKPYGGNPAIIPGMGIAKSFGSSSFDFPSTEAILSVVPNKFFNLQLGYGRNFIGDGYRSLLISDGASPYPYFKLDTKFWKIKYTNIYMWLKDVRTEAVAERTYTTKYMANHYLSWNVTNHWNIGFFESVVWSNTNNRGFDFYFVNPIIFYRSVEFSASGKTGNASIGLTSKYKWNDNLNFYGQFLIDEFSTQDVFHKNNSWKNKFGYQIGAKYYNPFHINNSIIQIEFNHVRPYTYSHDQPITNYGHNNQNIGHTWGSNFLELVAIARYYKQRWYFDGKFTYGIKGFDFNTPEDKLNYGSNIYRSYDENRFSDYNVMVGQGNKTISFMADVQAGYVVNSTTNLKFFANYIYRNFNPQQNTVTIYNQSTNWFTIGLRTDIFNWYFDY